MAKYSELVRALLDRVQYRVSELTVDASDMCDEAVAALKVEAAARGMHVSGTARWILVRQLSAPTQTETPAAESTDARESSAEQEALASLERIERIRKGDH